MTQSFNFLQKLVDAFVAVYETIAVTGTGKTKTEDFAFYVSNNAHDDNNDTLVYTMTSEPASDNFEITGESYSYCAAHQCNVL